MSKLLEQINKDKNEMTLGDVVTFHRGYDLPITEIKKGIYPVVFSNGRKEFHDEFKVKGPGVFTGRSGSLGGMFYIEENYWPHNTTLYVSDFHGNDPKYCYYFLSSFDFSNYNAGTGVPTLNRNHIHGIPVKIPDLPIQNKIAEILSTYDSKIENNNNIIKNLEATAQTIFNEWFVNFRFPGHEKVKMIESEIGEIPEGWEVSSLGQVSDNHDSKRIPLSSMERNKRKGNIPYYGANGILDYIDKSIFSGEYLLFAEDGTVKTSKKLPVIYLVDGDFWVNNHAHIISGNRISNYFLYLSLCKINIDQYITGGVQPKITQQNINSIPILIPDKGLLSKFETIVSPVKNKMKIIEKESMKLKESRDQLLAKLI